MSDVIEHVDFSVLCGHRGESEQNAAYNDGNSQCLFPQSHHNLEPAEAVDIAPYFDEEPHIRWYDAESFYKLAGSVLYAAKVRGIELVWGGDWKIKDLPHFQLVRK